MTTAGFVGAEMPPRLPHPHFQTFEGDREHRKAYSKEKAYKAFDWHMGQRVNVDVPVVEANVPEEHKGVIGAALNFYIDHLNRGRGC